MPDTRIRSAVLEQGISRIHVNIECPFYTELLISNGGALSRDYACHSLWDYYGNALISYKRAKANLVEESDLSLDFSVERARELFMAKAKQHGVSPADMVNYWPMVMRQQWAMGGDDYLPDVYKFHYWGN